jgi:hypothetical protein
MTGFDQLSHATHNPVFGLVWLLLQSFVAVNLLADALRRPFAHGTRPRYVLTTIVRTTAVPAILVKIGDIVLDYSDRDYGLVGIDVFVTMFLIASWFWTKDDDNWWKGRGRKIGRAIRGALTSTKTRTATA